MTREWGRPGLPSLVLGMGLVLAVSSWLSWKPCFDRDLQTCYDPLNERPGDTFVVVVWVLALLLCAVGSVRPYGRVGAATGLIVSILAVPILDPGFPIAGLNSADGNPGTGIICGLVIFVAGVLYATLREVDRRRWAAGMPPLGVPGE